MQERQNSEVVVLEYMSCVKNDYKNVKEKENNILTLM